MSKKQLKDVETDENWACGLKNFPFSNIDDDILKCLCSDIYWENSFCELMDKCTELNFETFKFNSANCKRSDFDTDIDPEKNLYNTTDLTCNYYTENQFNENIQSIQGVSVIYFNARSMSVNFTRLNIYLII